MSLHIVGAENLAQDQAVEVIVKFGRDKQPPYTPPTPKTIEITENGEHNVKGYDVADVDVPSVEPTGTLEITQNDIYDVSEYASVDVNVEASIELNRSVTVKNNASTRLYCLKHYDYAGFLNANYTYWYAEQNEEKTIDLAKMQTGVNYPLVFRVPVSKSITASGSIAAQVTAQDAMYNYLVVFLMPYNGITITVADAT